MKLVSSRLCPFVQRVAALLEAKQFAYEIAYIDLNDKPAWFYEISPLGQVPVLVNDEGQVLHESGAIVEYLEEVAGDPLYSVDPVSRAQERAWSHLAVKSYLLQCRALRSADELRFFERAQQFGKIFAAVEDVLGEEPYFRGGRLGMVDVSWLPLFHRAGLVERYTAYDLLPAACVKTKAWQQAILATSLPGQSVCADFESQFGNFYLSDRSFLGRLARRHPGSMQDTPAALDGCR